MLTTHDDPARAVVDRRRRASSRDGRARAAQLHARRARDHALHQRAHRAQGRASPGSSPPPASRDTLEIGRERKFELYDLAIAKPEPLVPRDLRLEVAERIERRRHACAGRSTARELAARARAPRRGRRGRRSPWCSSTPTRTRATRPRRRGSSPSAIREIFTTASHEVAPEIREFERASTTVANAYIKPLAHRYLGAHGAPARRAADPGAAPPDALERRAHPRGRGAARAGADARVRPRRRRARRRLLRPRGQRRATCSPSTWAAPPPSSRSSTAASRSPPTASRRRARSGSSRAAGCPSASRRSS